MAEPIYDDTWTRSGISLLWHPTALGKVARAGEVMPLREVLRWQGAWPAELPSNDGHAAVASDLEGVLSALSSSDAAAWLTKEFVPFLRAFERQYEGQAALVLWSPGMRKQIEVGTSGESYEWVEGHGKAQRRVPIGRLLWQGAEKDVRRILLERTRDKDVDGEAWAGLYQRRFS